MSMAVPTEVQKAHFFNDLECLTSPIGLFDWKGFFRGLSNRDGPPQKETAAQAGPRSGGKTRKQRRAFDAPHSMRANRPAMLAGGAP